MEKLLFLLKNNNKIENIKPILQKIMRIHKRKL
jgi:hypothetical protein